MNRYFIQKTYYRIFLLQFIVILTVLFDAGCYTDKKLSPSSVDMVVVFKPGVLMEKASSLLFEKEYIFHEGSDSSRGKKYLQETGPKYIVKVPKEQIGKFRDEMKDIPQIFEIYQADWSITKD